jgi:hypothetical protein
MLEYIVRGGRCSPAAEVISVASSEPSDVEDDPEAQLSE